MTWTHLLVLGTVSGALAAISFALVLHGTVMRASVESAWHFGW